MRIAIEPAPVGDLRPNPGNARTHSKKQITRIAESILSFGFANPILIDEERIIIAGHGRWAAAKQLGLMTVPSIMLCGLSPAKKRALLLADNRIAEGAGWDRQKLAIELPELTGLLLAEGLDITVTGFNIPEIDQLRLDYEANAGDPQDEIDDAWSSGPVVSKPGMLWALGPHRLLCGDARQPTDVDRLMGPERAASGFLDVPYNVKVADVVGRGRVRHREFAMASGEMSDVQYGDFLRAALGNAAGMSRDGAVYFICSDWRHITEVIAAGREVFGALLNLAVWVKTNAGQGSFYRSAHEMIPVFRVGKAPHLNNVELGRHGRNRSNVWKYPGVNTFRRGRMDDLRSHPTVKPVALVSDALKDCTRPGDIVLDTFCGSGTTILAAERVGRRGYGIEIDPQYVDVAVKRWQAFTGKDAVDAKTDKTFDEFAAAAASEVDDKTPQSSERLRGSSARADEAAR
jgi:DNA modification methylase